MVPVLHCRSGRISRLVAFCVFGLLCVSGFAANAQAQGWNAKETPFDFYVLALSWSPGFCETERSARGRDQCAIGKRYGFVVHGLWPQFERGYPSYCSASSQVPSRRAMDLGGRIFPEEGLARYQWRKHGSCTGLTPHDYFRYTAAARDRVTIPRSLQSTAITVDKKFAAPDVRQAFIAANPGLQSDMVSVVCNRGRLREVRVCLSRDLRSFRSCPAVANDSCSIPSLTVDAPR